MQQACKIFIDSIGAKSSALGTTYAETNEYWEPDEPPLTSLFAALGDRIAEEFDKGGEIDRSVSDLIERAMESDDEQLVTVVATGLIEAMVARAETQKDTWTRIAAWLGNTSRRHAEVWRIG